MSEQRRFVLAVILLLPGIITAVAAASTLLGTVSSFPMVLAAFELSVFGILLYLTIPLLGFIALAQLSLRQRRIHPASLVTLAVCAVLCAAWFGIAWSYGEKYQGLFTSYSFALLNAASVVLLACGVVLVYRRPSFSNLLVFHWCLVVWLASWPFPYFGEYP